MSIKDAVIINSRKAINKLLSYNYPEVSDNWEKYYDNPVIGKKNENSFFDPFVLVENGQFLMIVSNRKNNSIDLYKSKDGMFWNFSDNILKLDHPEAAINRASLVVTSSRDWKLFFTYQLRNKSCIKMIVSEKLNFQLNRAITCIGSLEESYCVMNPCVIWDLDEKIYKMWYAQGNFYEPDMLCYATSKDGIEWNKYNSPVLTKNKHDLYRKCKVGGCHVIKNSDKSYEMFYIGYQNIDVSGICHAFSDDGIHWKQNCYNPIIAASKKGWDCSAVYKPAAIHKNGYMYLWYNGRRNKQECIGLAMRKVANVR